MRHCLPLLALLLTACGTAATIPDGGGDGATPSEAAVADVSADTTPAPDAPAPDVSADTPVDTASGCVDADHDGYGTGCALGPDCNDADPDVHPGAPETCDGVDSDCDGSADTRVDPALDLYCTRSQPMTGHAWSDLPMCDYATRWDGTPNESRYPRPPAARCMGSYTDSAGVLHFVCWTILGPYPASSIPCM